MRRHLLFAATTVMFFALVYLVATRARDPHEMPRARPAASASSSAQAASASPVVSSSAPAASASSGPAPGLDRPLRVVARSWEAAAALLVANGGPTTADAGPVRAAGLDLGIAVSPDEKDVEQRLARGGADADGADVAVVPVPTAILANERLAALDLQAFFVVGWSRGREVLLGTDDALLTRPRTAAKETTVISQDESASVLAAFALGEVFSPPAVRVVAAPDGGPLVAFARPIPSDRAAGAPSKVLLTSADASHLVPIVAVAPRGFLETHLDGVASLVRAWLAGAATLKSDVPAVARQIAAEQGAPDPATVIERLGWIAPSDAADNVRALLVAQDGAMDVQALFRLEADLLESSGVLPSHQPDRAHVATLPLRRALGDEGQKSGALSFTPPADGARTWLAHKADKGDVNDLARQLAVLAGVFDRSAVRISTKPASLAREVAAVATDSLGVVADRVVVSSSPPPDGSHAWIEVLAAP